MYLKFTRSCRVELSIGNEHVFCSRHVYFSAYSNSTYKTFLCSSIERKPKNHPEFQSYCNICNYNNMPCIFCTASSHVCLWIEFDFFNRIFFTSLEMFFMHYKNEIVENKSVNFYFTKIFIIMSTNHTSRSFPGELGKHRALPESPERARGSFKGLFSLTIRDW